MRPGKSNFRSSKWGDGTKLDALRSSHTSGLRKMTLGRWLGWTCAGGLGSEDLGLDPKGSEGSDVVRSAFLRSCRAAL